MTADAAWEYMKQQEAQLVGKIFTREDLITRAREYVRHNSQGLDRAQQMVMFGQLVDFITGLFDPPKS